MVNIDNHTCLWEWLWYTFSVLLHPKQMYKTSVFVLTFHQIEFTVTLRHWGHTMKIAMVLMVLTITVNATSLPFRRQKTIKKYRDVIRQRENVLIAFLF